MERCTPSDYAYLVVMSSPGPPPLLKHTPLKRLRDPEAFAKCKRALEALQKQEDQGKIALYYFDESGFALDPSMPYAWQEPASVIELPAMRYGRINV